MSSIYERDLAWIHHIGFGEFATEAAPAILEMLRDAGIDCGLVVDLGCGSGLWARTLTDHGFDVIGVDASAAMIDLARQHAPRATFVQSSLRTYELPPCDVVTALGEPLSYIDDEPASLAPLFDRVGAALRPGGLLIFDLVITGDEPMSYRSWVDGDDWAVLVEVTEEVERRVITRNITTYRQLDDTYRRTRERHLVGAYDRDDVVGELERAGFAVKVTDRYGAYELPMRRAAFIARRR